MTYDYPDKSVVEELSVGASLTGEVVETDAPVQIDASSIDPRRIEGPVRIEKGELVVGAQRVWRS